MMSNMEQQEDVFRAVADPTRRAILRALRAGPKPVQEIVQLFQVSRPAVSRHLRVLRRAELVLEKKQGRKRVCQLDPRPLREMDRWLQEYRALWSKKP